MRIVKRSSRRAPKVSIVLIDWSVRESFHILHYFSKQNVDRDTFEVIVVEFYSTVSEVLKKFEEQVDTWVILENREDCRYHKHLMYNAGIAFAGGEIVVICDSDTMVKDTFISSIIGEFEKDPNIVLHLDQFRNVSREFYPFNYPSFDDVVGNGCINSAGGKTRGLVDTTDMLHTRNYGACMVANRDDLIAIGGADEHTDYWGYICGPYEMTFRLLNFGRREIWHQTEFIYHTWHQGQAGMDNFLGPHDGMYMSSTALEHLVTGRIKPYVENKYFQDANDVGGMKNDDRHKPFVEEEQASYWIMNYKDNISLSKNGYSKCGYIQTYNGFRIEKSGTSYRASLFTNQNKSTVGERDRLCLEADTLDKIKIEIDKLIPKYVDLSAQAGFIYTLFYRLVEISVDRFAKYSKRLTWWAIGKSFVYSATYNQPFMKRVPGRIKQFAVDLQMRADSLSSIVVNLYFLRQSAVLAAPSRDNIMLVKNIWLKSYFLFLAFIGVVPRVKLHVISDSGMLKRYLEAMEKDELDKKLIISKELYFVFHELMETHNVRSRSFIF